MASRGLENVCPNNHIVIRPPLKREKSPHHQARAYQQNYRERHLHNNKPFTKPSTQGPCLQPPASLPQPGVQIAAHRVERGSTDWSAAENDKALGGNGD